MAKLTEAQILELRQEFLSDPEGDLERMRSIIDADALELDAIPRLMRSLHALKGASQVVGLERMSKLLHDFESTCSDLAKVSFEWDQANVFLRRLFEEVNSYFESLKFNPHDGYEANWEPILKDFSNYIANLGSAADQTQEDRASDNKIDTEPTAADDWGMSDSTEKGDSSQEDREIPSDWDMASEDSAPPGEDESTEETTASSEDQTEPAQDPDGAAEFTAANTEEAAPQPVSSQIDDSPSAPPTNDGNRQSGKSLPTAEATSPKATDLPEERNDQYLLCVKSNQKYAIPVKTVREVLENGVLQPLPIERKGIAGVMTVRGTVLPILTMKSVFGNIEADASEPDSCIIVCNLETKVFGIPVDHVQRVITVDDARLETAVTPGTSDEEKTISHIGNIDNESVLFVDLRKALVA